MSDDSAAFGGADVTHEEAHHEGPDRHEAPADLPVLRASGDQRQREHRQVLVLLGAAMSTFTVLLTTGDHANARTPEAAARKARDLMEAAARRGASSSKLRASFYCNGRLVRSGVRRDEIHT